MDYNALLQRARKNLPEISVAAERFEVPKVVGHIQGNRTVISNFHQIAAVLRRDVNHVLKYVLKELATPGGLTKSALILGTKVPASRINEKIVQYVRDFVVCPVCRKPDTKLLKEDKVTILKCSACGARHPIQVRI